MDQCALLQLCKTKATKRHRVVRTEARETAMIRRSLGRVSTVAPSRCVVTVTLDLAKVSFEQTNLSYADLQVILLSQGNTLEAVNMQDPSKGTNLRNLLMCSKNASRGGPGQTEIVDLQLVTTDQFTVPPHLSHISLMSIQPDDIMYSKYI